MVASPIPRSGEYAQMRTNRDIASHAQGSASLPAPASGAKSQSQDWTTWVAAGAVVAGGALMVTGNRRAGLAVAAAGTALALIEEQDVVTTFWKNLPDYLNQAQDFLDQVERYMAEASIQGQRIQSILRR
jgi:hypothetical protein